MGYPWLLFFWFVIVVNCSQMQPSLCVFCVTSGALALCKIVLLDGKCFVILRLQWHFAGFVLSAWVNAWSVGNLAINKQATVAPIGQGKGKVFF